MSEQYQPYGSMPPPPPGYQQPKPKGPAPSSVVFAVRLMFARAALGLVTVVYVFAARDSYRTAIRNAHLSDDDHQLDTLVNTAVAVAIVFAVIYLILYTLLALQVRKGKNWARIVTWVLAGLGVVGALSSFAQQAPALTKVLGIIEGLLDVAIIVLLAQSASNPYFRKQ